METSNSQQKSKWWKPYGRWVVYIALVLLMRYTGILSYVSTITQSAFMKTGAMDIDVTPDAAAKPFDYNFKLVDLNNNIIDVSSFKGKTIFINLWATWCGPCRVEMPSIQNLYNSADKDKVVFVMLALDHKEPQVRVPNYIRDKGFTFPVYYPGSQLPELLKVRSIPTTFVINPKGEIVLKETGTANYDTPKFRNFLNGL